MKKDRFLWSAHRITERQKAGKARSIKGKQLKNSRNTASKPLVAHLSSASADLFNPILIMSAYVGSFWADIFYDVFSVTVRNIVPARSGGWT